MVHRVADVRLRLRAVGEYVKLEVVHRARVDSSDGLLREGENRCELRTGTDGVKSRKETGVARQESRKVFLASAAYKERRLAS